METIQIAYNKDNDTCTISCKELKISHFYDNCYDYFGVIHCITNFIHEFLDD